MKTGHWKAAKGSLRKRQWRKYHALKAENPADEEEEERRKPAAAERKAAEMAASSAAAAGSGWLSWKISGESCGEIISKAKWISWKAAAEINEIKIMQAAKSVNGEEEQWKSKLAMKKMAT